MGRARGSHHQVALGGFDQLVGARRGTGESADEAGARRDGREVFTPGATALNRLPGAVQELVVRAQAAIKASGGTSSDLQRQLQSAWSDMPRDVAREAEVELAGAGCLSLAGQLRAVGHWPTRSALHARESDYRPNEEWAQAFTQRISHEPLRSLFPFATPSDNVRRTERIAATPGPPPLLEVFQTTLVAHFRAHGPTAPDDEATMSELDEQTLTAWGIATRRRAAERAGRASEAMVLADEPGCLPAARELFAAARQLAQQEHGVDCSAVVRLGIDRQREFVDALVSSPEAAPEMLLAACIAADARHRAARGQQHPAISSAL